MTSAIRHIASRHALRHIASRVVALPLLALGAAGCGGGMEHVDANAFSWNAPMAAPGELHLRNMNGSIDVKPATGGNVTVTAETRWHRGNPKKDLSFVTIPSGNDFTVCALWGKGTCTAESYNTSGRSVLRSLFSGGTTDAAVNFTVYVPTGVKVDAFDVNGTVTILATAPVKAHSVNGSIKVGTSVGPVEATTVNGSVDARMTTLSGDGMVKVETMNGNASAYVPATFDGAVHVSTTNGKAGTDFTVTVAGGSSGSNTLDGTVGAGARRVEVTSMNGNAWLRKLNADGTVSSVTTATPAAKP
jgi:hypothetical protein